jgi:hypothetical protein
MEERGVIPLRTHGPEENVIFYRQVREMSEKLWPVRVLCCSTCKRLAFYEAAPGSNQAGQ